jgi:hypothetical protein
MVDMIKWIFAYVPTRHTHDSPKHRLDDVTPRASGDCLSAPPILVVQETPRVVGVSDGNTLQK